jgi:hypothetical protein
MLSVGYLVGVKQHNPSGQAKELSGSRIGGLEVMMNGKNLLFQRGSKTRMGCAIASEIGNRHGSCGWHPEKSA